MSNKKVLLIEDIEGSRNTYAEIIRDGGFSVDAVGNLSDAIALISKKTYHVAVVDITLDEDDLYNRDGLKVIQYLHDLKEGTESVILSGQPELEVAVEAFEKFGLVQYIEKRKLRKTEDLISAVEKAYMKAKIKHLGPFNSISSLFSGTRNAASWEHDCLLALKPSEGMKGLSEFLKGFCKPLTPLLAKKGSVSPTEIDNARKRIFGTFWSKGIGSAVNLIIGPTEDASNLLEELSLAEKDNPHIIHQYGKAKVFGLASSIMAKREVYVDHL